jgi:hypothetical protein
MNPIDGQSMFQAMTFIASVIPQCHAVRLLLAATIIGLRRVGQTGNA